MKIFLDFDGTVVNVFNRYYSIFRDFWGDFATLEEFIKIKKLFPKDRDIAEKYFTFSDEKFKNYLKFKRENLENPSYLSFDTINIDPHSLKKIFAEYDISIFSCRKNIESFKFQSKNLDINFVTKKTIITAPNGQTAKLDWFKKSSFDEFIMIGDSEVDMAAGIIPGCKTLFVKNGLRDLSVIPDHISPYKAYNDINELFDDIKNIL